MNTFIVEDSLPIRRLLVRRLETVAGIRVVGEASGETQALAMIEWLKPDTVLMDLSLANGGSGLKVLSQLRQKGFGGRVLVLTSQAIDAYRNACLQAGADGFYDKASGLDTLFSDLTDLMGKETVHGHINPASLLLRDALTGLFGEAALLERLDQAARIAHRDGTDLAVYVMRVEGLAGLAESHGVGEVNAVLHAISAKLREVCEPADVLARHAADQFSMVLGKIGSAQTAAAFAVRLGELMTEAIEQLDTPSELRAQIGMALFPADAIAPRSLLTLAEARAYGAMPPQQASSFIH